MKQRKDGRWEKSITINGNKVHFYSSAPTEKQAERDFQNQLLNYKEKETVGLMFAEVTDEWFNLKEKNIRQSKN